ncbi:MAG: hypothetical protein L3K00_04450 [Thermoplasmata archaeon]|nr:hypothetical protein [Thermoplasmata archaeon]
MSDTPDQAQMRQHLAELRHAAGGLGRDLAIDFEHIDEKINRLGKLGARDARNAAEDIHDDFAALAHALDQEARRLPHQVGSAASRAGAAIGDATSRFASATGAAIESAGSRAREGTRNALAHAAGVRRTPMKEWHTPSHDDDSSR